ncbi:MAG: hypothetical protein KC713_10460, partial [Candidatus Omnitrophica bacterium]|nr:hypothetical protein [Candidatus Omnitrophota bacterium]
MAWVLDEEVFFQSLKPLYVNYFNNLNKEKDKKEIAAEAALLLSSPSVPGEYFDPLNLNDIGHRKWLAQLDKFEVSYEDGAILPAEHITHLKNNGYIETLQTENGKQYVLKKTINDLLDEGYAEKILGQNRTRENISTKYLSKLIYKEQYTRLFAFNNQLKLQPYLGASLDNIDQLIREKTVQPFYDKEFGYHGYIYIPAEQEGLKGNFDRAFKKHFPDYRVSSRRLSIGGLFADRVRADLTEKIADQVYTQLTQSLKSYTRGNLDQMSRDVMKIVLGVYFNIISSKKMNIQDFKHAMKLLLELIENGADHHAMTAWLINSSPLKNHSDDFRSKMAQAIKGKKEIDKRFAETFLSGVDDLLMFTYRVSHLPYLGFDGIEDFGTDDTVQEYIAYLMQQFTLGKKYQQEPMNRFLLTLFTMIESLNLQYSELKFQMGSDVEPNRVPELESKIKSKALFIKQIYLSLVRQLNIASLETKMLDMVFEIEYPQEYQETYLGIVSALGLVENVSLSQEDHAALNHLNTQLNLVYQFL